jgi:hypothetical protein
MAFLRKHDQDEVLVLMNMGKEPTGFTIKDQLINGGYTNVFNRAATHLASGTFIKMKPWDYMVFERET